MTGSGDTGGAGASAGMNSTAGATLPLSVCIAAHNEAAIIERAIRSVEGWAREIIVVDCESTDATADVVRSCGIIVHQRPNLVPEANKNAALDLAQCEWVFLLDPDEVMPEDLRREIAETIARNPTENGFKVPRRNFYFGQPLTHGGTYPDRQLRLFRKGRGRYPGRDYHEHMVIEGSVGQLRNAFDHHPYPTFEVWLRKFDYYTSYGALVLAQRNIPITPKTIRRYMVVRPLRRWFERLILKRGISDGVPGVLAATFDLMTNVVSFGRYWMRMRGVEQNNRLPDAW